VLIAELRPHKRRHEILHNQRGRLLEAVLKDRTDLSSRRYRFTYTIDVAQAWTA